MCRTVNGRGRDVQPLELERFEFLGGGDDPGTARLPQRILDGGFDGRRCGAGDVGQLGELDTHCHELSFQRGKERRTLAFTYLSLQFVLPGTQRRDDLTASPRCITISGPTFLTLLTKAATFDLPEATSHPRVLAMFAAAALSLVIRTVLLSHRRSPPGDRRMSRRE